MPSQQKLRGTGIAAAVAGYIVGDAALSLTAAGGTQATAAAAYSDVNVFTTVAAGLSAILPSNRELGDTVEVSNLGANALSLFPPVGGQISNLGLNTLLAVPIGKTVICRYVGLVNGVPQWTSNLSA